jgi:hypothetical protein
VIGILLMVRGSAAGTERQYTLSKDANVEILSIQEFGVPDLTHRFTIYGDGRLVGRDLGVYGNSAVPENAVEIWLSSDETKAILDTLVGSGLIEFGPDVAKRRREIISGMQQEGEPETIAVSGDTAGISLRVSLASYESPQRTEVRPFVHIARIFNPRYLASQYRERGVAGQIPESEPQTFVEAEALSSVYESLRRLVYSREAR